MKYNLQKLCNTVLVATIYLLGTTRKSIGGVTRLSGGTATVWAGLSMVYGADASPTTVNLEAGVPVNILLDLTELTGTRDIASVVIKYPQNFTQNGLKLIPQFVSNYTQGEIREAHQILTDDVDRVTEKFSNGVRVDNEASLTSFLYSEGQLKWRYKTEGWAINSAPAINSDGTIYIGSRDNYLYAIYPNGNLKWRYRTGDGVGIFTAISLSNDGIIYAGDSDSYLYSIYPNGALKWKFRTNHRFIDSSPAISDDGSIYFGSWDSYLYAIHPNGTLKWKYQAENVAYTSPAISTDGTIYFGSCDSYLYAIYFDGRLKWRYQTGGEVISSPSIANDGTIYFGSKDHHLYAVYTNGTLRWKYQIQAGDFPSSPSISRDGTVYMGSYDKYIYAVHQNGTLKWRYLTSGVIVSHFSIGDDSTVYVASADSYLYAIYPDGRLRWKYKTDNYCERAIPAIGNDGTIYIGSLDSHVYSISSKTVLSLAPWPQFHQNILHTGVQSNQQGLQLFDIRYLRLEGTPTISGLLQLDLAMSAAQVPSFNMNINFITSPLVTNNNLSSCTVIAPVPDQLIDVNSQYSYQINGKQIFSGDIQYVGVTETGKSTLPASMRLERTYGTLTNTANSASFISKAVNKIAYMATEQGLSIVNLSNPDPSILGKIDIGGSNLGLDIKGTIAYMVRSWRGLYIIDVSNSHNPKILSTIDIRDAIRVKVSENVAYVTTEFGLQLVDIKDPNRPSFMGRITSGRANDVDIVGDLAYVAARSPLPNQIHQLQIVNVSNNYDPILLGRLATGGAVNGGWAEYVVVKENVAYVATVSAGLKLIDVSDPLHPKLLSTISASDNIIVNSPDGEGPTSIAVVGGLAYVGFIGEKLQIIDVGNPINPILLENYALYPYNADHVKRNGHGVGSIVVNNYISFATTTDAPNLHVINFRDCNLTGNFFAEKVYSLTATAYNRGGNKCGNVTWQISIVNKFSSKIDLQSGLVAYYPFNGNANDESGNRLDGTVYGATLAADRFGNSNKAYYFDGISNYIKIGDPVPPLLQIQNHISYSVWIKVPNIISLNGNFYSIVGCQHEPGYGTAIQIYDGGRLQFQIGDGSLHGWHETNTINWGIPIEQWVHIVATRNINEAGKIYYNGVLQATSAIPYNGDKPTTTWSKAISYEGALYAIGKQTEWDRYFNGQIDDVRIYNRALEPSEVIALYNEGNPINLQSGLVACYPFNGNANDESGNSHHGIVMGATLTSDKFGNTNKAYHFDGVSSYIKIPETSDLQPAYVSVSAWARRLCKNNNDWQVIVCATEIDDRYIIAWFDDKIRGCVKDGSVCLDSSSSVLDHNWHHIALTYEEGRQNLYVDGTLSANQATFGPITGYNSRWIGIGGEDDFQQGHAYGFYFCGDVDEVRIYNRVLTAAEVSALYNTPNAMTTVTPTPTLSYSASSTATSTETATPSLTALKPMSMPILINNKLTIKNGKVLTLTTKNFNASNIDGDYYNLLYRIIALRHGWFTYINTSNTEILSFSQKNITDGLVQFNHDGSKFAPHYNVTVSNGALTTTSAAARIVFDPVPIFYNNFLTISEGQSIILNPAMLKAGYPDDYVSDLSFNFIISDLQHGHFELATNPDAYITSFTQQSLSDSNIKFIHDNSDLPPSYKVAIDDGTVTTDPVAVNVTFIRAPFLTHNFLIINQGETLIVNNSMLSGSSDQTNNDSDLIFTVSEVKHGHFESINDPEIAITNFNQQQINNGQILFVHDGTDKVPSYKITISNGILTNKAQEARIRFNARSNDTSNIAAIIGGTLGGCLSSMVVAGVGLFFYKKRYSTSKLNQLERTLVPLVNAEKEEPIAHEQISILVNQSEVNPNVSCNSGLNEARSSLPTEESIDSKHKFHYNQNPTKHRKTLSL